ncbi:MAG: tetratricopeptide repeat protein [Ignavibacteria bacterium]|nr:tetratricopeptide repeat protein [Ignavibacteria bacterium]
MKRPIAAVFILSLLVFSSCSRKSAVELYGEAQAQESQKNFALAVERYGELVARFPTDARADSSQFRVAMIYQNELHDTRKAVHTYQRFHELFPQSGRAGTALFLSAFLYNNELHNFDSARTAYELFLQQYPNHQLAASARYELSNIGKDPSELMPGHVTSTEQSSDKKSGEVSK